MQQKRLVELRTYSKNILSKRIKKKKKKELEAVTE